MDRLEFIRAHAPCYIYDKKQIVSRCRELKAAIPQATFLYSVKANPFEPVVRTAAHEGFGADAASANEVIKAVRAGIPKELIFYSAPGKTDADFEKTWDKCTVIADSLPELDRLERFCAAKGVCLDAGVRINPEFSGTSSKFGIDEALLTGFEYAHLKITGLHVHLRSQILDTDALISYYENCYALAERMSRLPGAEMRFINFGSGIGAVYDASAQKPAALDRIGQAFETLARRNASGLQARFFIETGRFVTCSAGNFYTPVVDRKVSRGRIYLITQSGLNGFLRPAVAELLKDNLGAYPLRGQEPLYTSPGECAFNVPGRTGDTETVDIAGPLCTALDVLARDVRLPHAEPGDIIEVTNAGSYGYPLSPVLFAGQDAPGEYLWEET